MSLSGSSQATAVAGGATALVRSISEEVGISSPSASLVKAVMINGAKDVETLIFQTLPKGGVKSTLNRRLCLCTMVTI